MKIHEVKLTAKIIKRLDYLDCMTFPEDDLYPKEGRRWWLVEDKEGPIGFSGLEKLNDSTAFLCRIGVFQRFSGLGIGKRLIRTMERHAKKQGFERLVSYTLPDNYKSLNNLIRCGYKVIKPSYSFGFKGALHLEKML